MTANTKPAQGYIVKALVAIDMLIATLIWRDADITISAFTGLALRTPHPPLWARVLGTILDWIAAGHCEDAIVNDAARAKAALVILEPK